MFGYGELAHVAQQHCRAQRHQIRIGQSHAAADFECIAPYAAFVLAIFRIAAFDGSRQRFHGAKMQGTQLFDPAALRIQTLQVEPVRMDHPIQHGDNQESDLPAIVAICNGQKACRAATGDIMRKRPEERGLPGLVLRETIYAEIDDGRQNHQQR